MQFVTKLLTGGDGRSSRLHDKKGNFCGWHRVIRNGPRACVTGLLRIAFDLRPEVPWISYDAISVIEKHLDPATSRVLEFGSGMSTVWLARHAKFVVSVDDFLPWYQRVSDILRSRRIENVSYKFSDCRNDYVSVANETDELFDLVLVDGSYRDDCVAVASKMLRPGGMLYLDNSDALNVAGVKRAEEIAIALPNCTVTSFTDFAPTQLFVQEGLLIRFNQKSADEAS